MSQFVGMGVTRVDLVEAKALNGQYDFLKVDYGDVILLRGVTCQILPQLTSPLSVIISSIAHVVQYLAHLYVIELLSVQLRHVQDQCGI